MNNRIKLCPVCHKEVKYKTGEETAKIYHGKCLMKLTEEIRAKTTKN